MKTKAKSEKCPLTERIRKRITLSIDPDHHEFIKKEGFNVSRFLDTAINALKTNVSISELQITTFTTANHEKNEEYDGPVRIRTGDLRRVRATS